MKELKNKKYIGLMLIVIVFMIMIGISEIGKVDLQKGQVKVEKVEIDKVSMLSANIQNVESENKEKAKGYDEVKYIIKYALSEEENIDEREVIIKASLTEAEGKYASFKEIKKTGITSTVSKNKREIEIRVEKAKVGEENKIEVIIVITNAPNGYKVKPKIEIKEVSEEEYKRVISEEVEVETKSITGIVIDEEKMSVSNIELSLYENNKETKRTYTDENGQYVFSDIEDENYEIKVEEEKYKIEKIEEEEGIKKIKVKNVKPYEIEVKKYVNSITVNGNKYTYGKVSKVQQAIKKLKEISGEVEYIVEVKNIGEKEGIITLIKDEMPEGLSFDKTKNAGWEEKEGKIYNRNLEGITLKSGQTKELRLILDIEKTEEAKTYINKVTAKGEIYEKVVFVLNGKVYKEKEVLEGEKIEEIQVGLENFSGWYTDKKYTNKYNFKNEVTKDIILYGKTEEEAKTYTVTFIDWGEIIDQREYEYGSIIVEPEREEREGYDFKYWYKDDENEAYDILKPVEEDLVLYSHQEIKKYEITFKNYDGTVLQSEEVEHGQIPEYKGPEPTREETDENKYKFDKWTPEITPAKEKKEYIADFKSEKKIYKLTYIEDEVKVEETEYEYGSVILEERKATPIEGHNFDGWYNENNEKQEFPLTITRNITLKGTHKPEIYKVRFYHNNEKYIDDQKVTYGNLASKPEIDPTEEDHNFAGWVIRGSNSKYNFNTPVTSDIDLESSFSPKPVYKVKYIVENKVINEQEVIEGKKANRIEDPTKKGYKFDGWYTTNEYTEEYNFDTVITEDKNLYGRFNPIYHTVTYKVDSKVYAQHQVLDEYTANKIDVEPPKGYTFNDKWYKDEEYTEEYDFNTPVTKDITIYGHCEINKYLIRFIGYGGEILQSEELEYGSMPEYKGTEPPLPETEEYTYSFGGWDKELKIVEEDRDYVVVPIPTKKKYTIIFANEDGTVLQSEELEYGSMPEYKGATPTKENTEEYTYTFKDWNKEVAIVTKNDTYVATYTETKNKYTVIFMDDDVEYARISDVDYGLTVSAPQTNPSKEFHLFLNWKLNDQIYDFNTPVKENIILNSSYELIEKPTISHTPSTEIIDNQEVLKWTNDKVIVTISSNHEEYTYEYKIDYGEYQPYNGPFEIYENCTIVAKSIKNGARSDVQSHDIANIDKIKPTLNLSQNIVGNTSFSINLRTKDDESGMNYIKLYKDGVYETTINYTDYNSKNEEKISTPEFTGLIEGNTYNISAEAYDRAGNISDELEIDVTTTISKIVARKIGVDNQLYTDESSYTNYSKLEYAIDDCKETQCTIQMVDNTDESVQINSQKNITLDINGKTINGVRDYTVENSGIFKVIDNSEIPGVIINSNPNSVAIKNLDGATLQLGENDIELNVSEVQPHIVGTDYGVYTLENATFNFYDGKIEGNIAIQGKVNDTPDRYNANITNEDHQIGILLILADAEARIIGGKYYTKLAYAVSETKNGEYIDILTTNEFLQGFTNQNGTLYSFDYDEENHTLTSNNNSSYSTATISTVIDLTNYNYDQYLEISGYLENVYTSSYYKSKGYFTVSSSDGGIYEYDDNYYRTTDLTTNKIKLEKGHRYTLKLNHEIPYSSVGVVEPQPKFIVTSILMSDYEESILTTEKNPQDEVLLVEYGFDYDEETKSYKSNNQYKPGTTAFSYIELDLTNEENDKLLIVNASLDTSSGNYANILVKEDNSILSYASSYGNDLLAYIYSYNLNSSSTNSGPKNYSKILTKGKKYYLQFYYFRNSSYTQEELEQYGLTDTFTINSVDLIDNVSESEVNTYDLSKDLITNGSDGYKNYNGYYGSYYPTKYGNGILSDSYIKIDLTDKEENQLLVINSNLNSSYDAEYFYLTNNKKTVTYNEIKTNKDKTLLYDYNDYYYNQRSGYYDYKYILEKGNVYYLHVATYGLTSYSSYSYLKSVKTYPIRNSKISVGKLNYFVGTEYETSQETDYVIDSTDNGNLRYVGTNANNYVTFNNEPWRILGVFDTKDENDNVSKRIKLVRSSSIGSYSWDTSAAYSATSTDTNAGNGINEWSQADLMKLLNPGYDEEEIGGSLYWLKSSGNCYSGNGNNKVACDFTTSGLSESARDMIDTVIWNTGAIPYDINNLTPNQIYEYEQSNNTGKTNYTNNNGFPADNVERTYKWTGKVGIMSMSEYIMTMSDSPYSSSYTRNICLNGNSQVYGGCLTTNSWMYSILNNSRKQTWTLNPLYAGDPANSSYFPMLGLTIPGGIGYNITTASSSNEIYPTVYLSTKVKIKEGDGSSSTPYIFELDSKSNDDEYYGLTQEIEQDTDDDNVINITSSSNDYLNIRGKDIYGFDYNELTNTYTSTTQNIPYSFAVSYAKIDLTSETEPKEIALNYNLSSNSSDFMYINLMQDTYTPSNYKNNGLNLEGSLTTRVGNSSTPVIGTIRKVLEPGHVYYIQFAYDRTSSNAPTESIKNQLEITFNLIEENEKTDEYTRYDGQMFLLNEQPDTVQIIRDVVTSETLDISERKMILDLNGYTLSSTNEDYAIKNSGDLTIIDSKYDEKTENYKEQLDVYYGEGYDYEQIDLDKNNFTSNVTIRNTNSNELEVRFGGKISIVYNKKIVVSDCAKIDVYASGDYSNENTYIGFATTQEVTIDDYVSYQHLTKDGSVSVEVDTPGEYYLKIIAQPSNYAISTPYIDISNLSITKSKILVSKIDDTRGSIISTTTVIKNEVGASLDIKSGKIITNTKKNNIYVIQNEGKLKFEEEAYIKGSTDISNGNLYGIYHTTTGENLEGGGTIELTGSSEAVGIWNSGIHEMLSDFNIKSSGYGIKNINQYAKTFKNLNIKASKYGISFGHVENEVEISDSTIDTTDVIDMKGAPSIYWGSSKNLIVKNVTIKGSVYNSNSATITILDSQVIPASSTYSPKKVSMGIFNSSNGKFIIDNSSLNAPYSYSIYNLGTMEVSNSEISSKFSGDSPYSTIYNGGEITLKNDNILNSSSANTVRCIYNAGKTKIEGGKMYTVPPYSSSQYDVNLIYNTVVGLLDIYDLEVNINNLSNSDESSIIYNNSTNPVNIYSGSFKSEIQKIIYNKNSGEVNIYNGDFDSKNQETIYNNSNGNINIYGGTFNSLKKTIHNKSNGAISIYGGTILSSIAANSLKPKNAAIYNEAAGTIKIGNENDDEVNNDLITIKGDYSIHNQYGVLNYYEGTLIGQKDISLASSINNSFDGYNLDIEDDLENNLEEIRLKIPNNNIVEIDNIGYKSIQEAVSTLTENSEQKVIKVISNIIDDKIVTISDNINVKIDLNGYSIRTYTPNEYIENAGNLTIDDSTKFTDENTFILGAGRIIQTGKYLVNNSGNLTFNAGTFETPKGIDSIALVKNSNHMTINNGQFISYSTKYAASSGNLYLTAGSNTTINNGTFDKYGNGWNINNKGNLTLNSGNVNLFSYTFEFTSTAYRPKAIKNDSSGTISMNENTIISEPAIGVTVENLVNYGYANLDNINLDNLYNYSDGVVDIIGGQYGIIYNNYNEIEKSGTININKLDDELITVKINTIKNYSLGKIFVINSKFTTISGTSDAQIENNDNGVVKIDSSSLSGIVKNLGTGFVNVTNSTITSKSYALYNESLGTITIGTKGDRNADNTLNVSEDNPYIKGNLYGVYNKKREGIINFYDGCLVGSSANYGTIKDIEDYTEITSKIEDNLEKKFLSREETAKVKSTGEKYFSIDEAIGNAASGDTIIIIRNVTTTETTPSMIINKNVTIDLFGHKININNDKYIINNGTLEFEDSSADKKGEIIPNGVEFVENTGVLTLNEVKISSGVQVDKLIDNKNTLNIDNSTITIQNAAKFIDNNGIINSNSSSINLKNSVGIYNNSESTINFVNTTVDLENAQAVYNDIDGILNITNGSIKESMINAIENNGILDFNNVSYVRLNTSAAYLIKNNENGVVNVDGKGSDSSKYSISLLENYGTATVKNIHDLANSTHFINRKGNLKIIDSEMQSKIDNYSNEAVDISNCTLKYNISNYSNGIVNINDSSLSSMDIVNNDDNGIINIKDSFMSGGSSRFTNVENAESTINIKNLTVEGSLRIINKGGVVNIDGLSSDSSVSIENSSLMNIKDIYFEYNSSESPVKNSGVLNIYSGTIISKRSTAIVNSYSGVTNIGNNEDDVTIDNLKIQGNPYAIDSDYANEGITYYDGVLIGTTKPINTLINEIPNGYDLNLIDEDGLKSFSLIQPTGNNVSIDSSNYSSIQSAVDTLTENNETVTLKLNKDLVTASQIVIPQNINLKIDFNGHTIYDYLLPSYIINNGNLSILDSNITSLEDDIESKIISNRALAQHVIITNNKNLSISNLDISNLGIENAKSGTLEINSSIINYIKNLNQLQINSGTIYEISNSSNIDVYGGLLNVIRNGTSATMNMYDGEIDGYVNNYSSTFNMYGGYAHSSKSVVLEQRTQDSIINIYGGHLLSTSSSVNYSGTINIYGGLIESTVSTAIVGSNSPHPILKTGYVTIGYNDGNVDNTSPIIKGATYGVSGTIYFYDGIVYGGTKAFKDLNNVTTPIDYRVLSQVEDGIEHATLAYITDNEKVAIMNKINFSSLQEAINSASDTEESIIILCSDIILDSDINVPSGKNIILYLNEYTITEGEYSFTGEGSLTRIDEKAPDSLLASIVNTVKKVLNINQMTKNIIVYEYENGEVLDSSKTYRLLKKNDEEYKQIKVEKEEEIGRYIIGNEQEELRAIRGRLYLNNLTSGEYKVMDDMNKEISFTITEEGKVIGHVIENNNSGKTKVEASAIAELIITITTGITIGHYGLLIFLIATIIVLMKLVIKKKEF